MKKIIFGLIATVLIGIFGNAQNSRILKDIDFIQFVKKTELIKTRTKNISNLKELSKLGKLDEKTYSNLYTNFDFSSHNEFELFFKEYYGHINNLEKKYSISKIKESDLIDLFVEGHLIIFPTENQDDNNSATGNNCLRRYNNCTAIAFATAVGGYIACASATIGYPICAGAVFILHLAMADNCSLDYAECKG